MKVFVGQIPKTWGEEELTEYFQKHGEILETQIIRDIKGSHRLCGFVKFASLTQADEAIKKLQGVMLEGMQRPMELRWADGETERLGLTGVESNKLFIGSIPQEATQENLNDLFQSYGDIEELHMLRDEHGVFKKSAFVKYFSKESCLLAIRALNAQAFICNSSKPIEVRFADKKKGPAQQLRNANVLPLH